VAPKDRPSGSKKEKSQRRVFAVDPISGQLMPDWILDTTTKRIIAEAQSRGIALPTKTTKKGNLKVDIKVQFSSIAVHGPTGHIYALSAVDDALYVFDQASHLIEAYIFEADGMQQVEGMTFLPNGDLVIASEGQGLPSQMQLYPANRTQPK
jgi:uncharacterized protein YjiK